MSSKLFGSFILIFLSMFLPITIFAQTKKASSYKPGQTFKDCPTCPEMVVIPAGSFIMGSPDSEVGRFPEEGPQHSITIKQFACGKFDITKQQWAAFVAATNRHTTSGCQVSIFDNKDSATSTWENNPISKEDNDPVVCINWNDAQDYINWLSKKTGKKYRMLSEAEWEYADRAGTTTAYYWGDSASHEYANYGTDTAAGIGFAFGRDKWIYASPVGSFPPNQFGLYDMNGNVMQWVDDCFAASYLGLPTDGSAYKEAVTLKMNGEFAIMNNTSSCDYKMIRGGDEENPPRLFRSAYRTWNYTNARSGGITFRVARTP